MNLNLRDFMTPEYKCKFDTLYEKYYVSTYNESTLGDLYDIYPDAPMWGEGKCSNFINCPHDHCCLGDIMDLNECYDDEAYNKWFEKFELSQYDLELILDWRIKENNFFESVIGDYFTLNMYDLHKYNIDIMKLLEILNVNQYNYIIYKSLCNNEYLYIKKYGESLPIEIMLFFKYNCVSFFSDNIAHLSLNDYKKYNWYTFAIDNKYYNDVSEYAANNIIDKYQYYFTYSVDSCRLYFKNIEDYVEFKMKFYKGK